MNHLKTIKERKIVVLALHIVLMECKSIFNVSGKSNIVHVSISTRNYVDYINNITS